MKQLPEMLKLLGRMFGVIALICSVIGIMLALGILLKENPTLALGVSLSVLGLVVAILNLAAKGRKKRTLEIDLRSAFTYDDLELAFHGVISALALLGDMGYTGGYIYEGLSRAVAILDATIKDASVENALRHVIPPEGTREHKDTKKMQTMTPELDRIWERWRTLVRKREGGQR